MHPHRLGRKTAVAFLPLAAEMPASFLSNFYGRYVAG